MWAHLNLSFCHNTISDGWMYKCYYLNWIYKYLTDLRSHVNSWWMIGTECLGEDVIWERYTLPLAHTCAYYTSWTKFVCLKIFGFCCDPSFAPRSSQNGNQWNPIYGKTVIRKSNYGWTLYTYKHTNWTMSRCSNRLNTFQNFIFKCSPLNVCMPWIKCTDSCSF